MKEIWVLEYRNDRYCEHEITLYETQEKAEKALEEWINIHKDEEKFDCGNRSARWIESNGDFVGVIIYKKEVK